MCHPDPTFLVPLSYYCHARRGRSADRTQCPQSSGAPCLIPDAPGSILNSLFSFFLGLHITFSLYAIDMVSSALLEFGHVLYFFAHLTAYCSQNQRQKARRPQVGGGGDTTPLSRPTQSSSGMGPASLPNTGISGLSISSAFAPQGTTISPSASHVQPPPSSLSTEVFPEAGPSGSRGSLDSSGVLGTRWHTTSSPSRQHRRLTSAPEWEISRPASTNPQEPVLELQSYPSHPSHRTTHVSRTAREVGRGNTPVLEAPRPVIIATPLSAGSAALTMKQLFPHADEGGAPPGSQQTGRTLPPINSSAWDSQQRRQHHHDHGSSVPTVDPCVQGNRPFPLPASSTSSPSQLHRRTQGGGGSGDTGTESGPTLPNIPAPFTLQPQPQWDPRTFAPTCKPDFSAWTRGPSSSPGSTMYQSRPARQSFSSFGVFGAGARGEVSDGDRRSVSPGLVLSPALSSRGSRTTSIGTSMHQHSYSVGASTASTSASVNRDHHPGHFRAMTPPSHARTYRHASPAGRREQ